MEGWYNNHVSLCSPIYRVGLKSKPQTFVWTKICGLLLDHLVRIHQLGLVIATDRQATWELQKLRWLIQDSTFSCASWHATVAAVTCIVSIKQLTLTGYLLEQRFFIVLLAEFLIAMVTQRAKDLAERRPKNNTHTSIGIFATVLWHLYGSHKTGMGNFAWQIDTFNLSW